MCGDELKNALMKGNVVVVAGAGISKDMPANLPSWWEYNILLIEMIGKLGAEALNMKDNLLEMDVVQKGVPVVSVSDFFVNRIAGRTYFPLLEMLDGAAPNVHHMMLAALARQGRISGIVTTNYDTLIEKAFQESSVPYDVYSDDESYQKQINSETFPIYKIHGSAENALHAIDTAQQKIQGLSNEKKHVLKNLFSENHLLFMGFSGEDFLFGTDYIPVRANKGNDYGITWLAHPGSTFNKQTQNLIDELQINVLHTTLQDFYNMQGWVVPDCSKAVKCTVPFRQIASEKIRALLEEPHIGKWACTGMCIELLDLLNKYEQAERIMDAVKRNFSEKNQINYFDIKGKVSLLSAMSKHLLSLDRLDEANEIVETQMQFFDMEDKMIKKTGMPKSEESYRERMLNRSTVLNRAGQIFLCKNMYSKARNVFAQVFWLAYQAMHWENISVAICNIALCDYKMWWQNGLEVPRVNNFIAITESAVRVAKHSGRVENIFEMNMIAAELYAQFGQRALYNQAIKNAEEVYGLCLEKEKCIIKMEKIKAFQRSIVDMPPWKLGHMPLCDCTDNPDAWDYFTGRPILKYQEGKTAKELFDNGEQDESISYMIEKIPQFIECGQLEEADAFSNCLAGIFLDYSNKLNAIGRNEIGYRYIVEGKRYYEKCLELECQLGRIDYMAGTLGSLARINSFEGSDDMLYRGLFQAELSLCICEDPKDCWEVILALDAACNINLQMGKKDTAREYCERYCNITKEFPKLASPVNVARMNDLLNSL